MRDDKEEIVSGLPPEQPNYVEVVEEVVQEVRYQTHASQPKHQDKDEEYFRMTYLANILEHKKRNKLIEIFGNDHYKELFIDVKDQ